MSVPLEEVQSEWQTHRGLDQLKAAGTHFNIFQDLYGGQSFRPLGFMEVAYGEKMVHRGTILTPSEVMATLVVWPHTTFSPFLCVCVCVQASSAPRVSGLPRREEGEEGLCSLVLSNPDGHLLDHTRELLHWMV